MEPSKERRPITDVALAILVSTAIDELMERKRRFTAYTVTTILRTANPGVEIEHPRVRYYVQGVMRDVIAFSGEWTKQDGVIFENATGPARLYSPVDAEPVPQVVVVSTAPTSFEPL